MKFHLYRKFIFFSAEMFLNNQYIIILSAGAIREISKNLPDRYPPPQKT